MVFTGLAILTAYSEIIFYNKNKFSYIGSAVGIVGFLLAFILNFYSVGLGELIAALVISFNIIFHLNKILE